MNNKVSARPFAGFGFGGAQFIELERFQEVSRPGDVVFFGVDKELSRQIGNQNPGAATFVREKTFCMMPWTHACATASHDIGIVTSDDPEIAMQAVLIISKYITSLGCRPALIGCDHTASMAGVMGAADGSLIPPVYLYFDAHFDLGLHRKTTGLHNGNFVNFLLHSDRINKVVNVGGRSWSTFAPVYSDIPGFACVPGGVPHATAEEVIERLSCLRGTPLYVSIDADVLDPSCAPNVSCPEPFGMSVADLFIICEWIGKSCEVIGSDLCEIIPSNQSLVSEQALMRCLHALFPKRRARS